MTIKTIHAISLVLIFGMVLAFLMPAVEAVSDAVTIMQIQGVGHISPLVGKTVTTHGIVTALAFNGYYVQDPDGDGNDDTSDGIFVFTGGAPDVAVGDEVELTDEPSEFIPGGADTGNLSITQLSFPDTTVLSKDNPLPAPVVIGTSGRVAPAVDVITKDERPVNLQEDPGVFNPDNDGIDFYESLEGMLVTIEQPVAVSATRTFTEFSSELFTLTNDGTEIAPEDARSARGGVYLQPDPDNDGDQNPERVQIQFDGTLFPEDVPEITVGDQLEDVTGVVGYSFGNFEVNALAPFEIISSDIERETTSLVGTHKRVTVASYNVLNHSAIVADDNQRMTISQQIVENLGSPDVLALQEIQDNNGSNSDNGLSDDTMDGVVDATETLKKLVKAIREDGGPRYRFVDVAPEEGTSGGIPGGNIRNAFLYNPQRVKLLFYYSLTPKILKFFSVSNPDAFLGTRNPLVAKFKFKGKAFTVINNHLTSRFGSTPIFGGPQPFIQAGEDEREAQCLALNQVVRKMKRFNRHTRIMVLGDLNTFQWTNDLTEILPGYGANRVLSNLINRLKDDNLYTFIFDGNSQVLDHFFVTKNLLPGAEIDIVHVNVDFPRIDDFVGSDHEPIVVRLNLKERKQ
jgi:predicted extracellular nuclease